MENNSQIIGGQGPGRNELCPCESGLKYKKCHGDPVKLQKAQQAAVEKMNNLIVEELYKQKVAEKGNTNDTDTTNGKLPQQTN